MRQVLLNPLNCIIDWWIALQVELHGQYSLARLRAFDVYASTISLAHAFTICFLSPLPCLALITLIDCMPLASPTTGAVANTVYWVRNSFIVLLMTH